jgi:two-component system OmpR family response regulator
LPDNVFIALVEDDPEIRQLTVGLLEREGWEVAGCADAAEFNRLAGRRRIDLLLLDLMLPGEDGLSICRRVRAGGDTPILMVTAKGDDVDRIVGLELGADDYLPKPYNPRELVARIRALLRRTRDAHRAAAVPGGEVFVFVGWRLETGGRALTAPDGAPVALTGAEFDLLLSFLTHPQRVLTRDQLLDWTRGRNANPYDRAVDVQLSRLRRKLAEAGAAPDLIKTVRGGGYLFSAAVEKPTSWS